MKFHHEFILKENNGSNFIFESNDNLVRLDFFNTTFRVAIYKKDEDLFPTFSVCPDDKMPLNGRNKLSSAGFLCVNPEFIENKSEFIFEFDNKKIIIKKLNFEISYLENDVLLFKDREVLAYNFDGEFGNGSIHYLTREEDEEIFGLGDKTGNVNKNKQSFKLSTSDSMGFDARSSDPLYKHIPFFICRNKVGSYGIYYDTYSQGEFNFGREINNYYNPFKYFRCDEEALVYYVFFGSVAEILNKFASIRGHDFFPQKRTLSYCGSTMSFTDAPNSEELLNDFVKKCDDYHIKCGGFYLSSGYTQIGEKRYVFHWNKDKIKSPEKLAKFFASKEIEFLPNVKPCFLTDHPMYDEIAKRGGFLKYSNGEPAIFPFWSGNGSYLDFTNVEAARFWTECVKRELVDRGYLNTWNDNNEYDIQDEDVFADGFGHKVKAKLIRPLFSYLMTRASLEAQKNDVRKVAVSRSGIVGTGRIASTWTGDNRTSFEDFRYNHKMAMTMSLSGIYNFGQDLGGFSGERPNKELFLRWIQYGVFTPRFVLHSWNNDGSSTMPWLYPEEKETVQKLFNLREELIPYLYNEVYRSTQDNNPIIYPLFLKHDSYDVESDAFYFGNSIISLPVFDEGKDEVEIDLPSTNGNWYLKNENVKGHIKAKCTIHDEPIYFVKGGSIILRNDEFVIYPLDNGVFECEYFLDDGKSNLDDNNHEIIKFKVECNEKQIKVKYSSKSKIKIKLVDYKNRDFIIKN